MLSRNPTSRWLGPILIGLAQPAAAATGGWTGSDLIAVLVLGVLALLAGWLVGRRTALRSDNVLPAAMDSDQRLKWALWGSGDSFWIWEVVDDVLSWSSASRCASNVPNITRLPNKAAPRLTTSQHGSMPSGSRYSYAQMRLPV